MRCCINVLNAIDHSNLFDLFIQIVVFRLFAGEFELFVLKRTKEKKTHVSRWNDLAFSRQHIQPCQEMNH